MNYNSYINNYRTRIPTNGSNESSSSMHYKQLWNDEKKKYSCLSQGVLTSGGFPLMKAIFAIIIIIP